MLELRSITKIYGKTYGGVKAVNDVNLIIKDGEFFSLLGPSGCGKTTLLRMLSGIETPTSGEIIQDGERIDNLPANRRQFNMVFQRYALFPHLNVRDNIAFGLKMKRVAATEIHTRVQEALALVQMESFASRAIGTLSGGQQQRIALARAFVNRPKVLLLDEPLSALDLKLRQQMQVELIALQRRLKHTFIFVTHDQEEALTLSDRIAVMNGGVVEQVGTAQEIYEHPKSLFVAQFIGSVNTIEGEVLGVSADSVSIGGHSKRPLTVKATRDGSRPLPQATIGAQARILVRPEKLRLLKSQPPADHNFIEGTLKEILYQGPITQFLVAQKENTLAPILVTQPNTAVTARRAHSLGDPVFVSWFPEDCILMGKDTTFPMGVTSVV
jgi:spermidine/putrescine transport system ATP-binding protein